MVVGPASSSSSNRRVLGVVGSITPQLYAPESWWKTSAGAKDVLTEAIAWAWVTCFFDPPPQGLRQGSEAPKRGGVAEVASLE